MVHIYWNVLIAHIVIQAGFTPKLLSFEQYLIKKLLKYRYNTMKGLT